MKPEESVVSSPPTQDPTSSPSPSKLPSTDFLSGFFLGVLASLFSFYLLRFFKSKREKRRGMLYGCLVSFVMVVFLCVSFTCYTFYVQKTIQVNRKLVQHDQKIVKIGTFTHFLGARVLKLVPDKVEYEKAPKTPPKAVKNIAVSHADSVKQRRRKIVR